MRHPIHKSLGYPLNRAHMLVDTLYWYLYSCTVFILICLNVLCVVNGYKQDVIVIMVYVKVKGKEIIKNGKYLINVYIGQSRYYHFIKHMEYLMFIQD